MSYVIALLIHLQLKLDHYITWAKTPTQPKWYSWVLLPRRNTAAILPAAVAIVLYLVFLAFGDMSILPDWLSLLGRVVAAIALIPALYVGARITLDEILDDTGKG